MCIWNREQKKNAGKLYTWVMASGRQTSRKKFEQTKTDIIKTISRIESNRIEQFLFASKSILLSILLLLLLLQIYWLTTFKRSHRIETKNMKIYHCIQCEITYQNLYLLVHYHFIFIFSDSSRYADNHDNSNVQNVGGTFSME